MCSLKVYILFALMCNIVRPQEIYETDVNVRIDPGSRTCFFEKGKAGQVMEIFYQVIDGQHGELDINADVLDPKGTKLISDYKKSENSIIMDLEQDGDYVLCLDNTYSLMNSKLVFVYFVIEDKTKDNTTEGHVAVVDNEGGEHEEVQIFEWIGKTENGTEYRLDVTLIIDSMIRILNHVVKARHLLDMYSASKSRDSYLAVEDTFIVDAWSAFQIAFMIIVGYIQVYLIKKLFTNHTHYAHRRASTKVTIYTTQNVR